MKNRFAYRLIMYSAKIITVLLARVEIEGRENLLSQGSYIGTSNHVGRLEVLLAYYMVGRDDLIMIIAEKYRESAFWRWLARMVDGIFIDRYNADFTALREVLKRLKQGGIMAIAPEGTRSKSGKLMEGHLGAAFLAAKSGVPVIPVGVTGTEDHLVLASLKHFKRVKVKVRVGKAYQIPPLTSGDREAQLQRATDEIMCQIAALLPENQRGYYRDYPRVLEILKQI